MTPHCRHYSTSILIVIFVLFSAISPYVRAESQKQSLPLWEWGIGVGYAALPGYIGSNFSDEYIFPFPIFYYRGQTWKVSRRSIDAVFFESERMELKLSMNGAPPVDSFDNPARLGMEDLDATLEIGPSFLLRHPMGDNEFELEIPLRSVLATDGGYLGDKGFVFNPKVRWRHQKSNGSLMIRSSVTLATVWGTDRFFDYYYGVDDEEATGFRSSYQPGKGFGGYYISTGTTFYYDRWRVGIYIRYHDIKDATFNESPLVERNSSTLMGFYLNRIIKRSSRYVLATE